MDDLDRARTKLIDTIGCYNLTTSNGAKFNFSKLKEDILSEMMVEFAKEYHQSKLHEPDTLPIEKIRRAFAYYVESERHNWRLYCIEE